MRKYLALIRTEMMRALVYRAGFFISLVGNLVFIAVLYFLWSAIYGDRTEMNGLSFDEAMLYVALGSTVFVLLNSLPIDWIMSYIIREGEIVGYLIKPIDFQAAMLTIAVGSLVVPMFVVTIPSLALLIGVFDVTWPWGIGTLLAIPAFVFAFLINFNFSYTVGLSGFYTESIWGLSIVKDTLVLVFSGALLPLPFFPEGVREVLMWLPFQAVYHTPLTLVTQPTMPVNEMMAMIGVQVIWVVVLFTMTRLMYNHAIRVLRIAGG